MVAACRWRASGPLCCGDRRTRFQERDSAPPEAFRPRGFCWWSGERDRADPPPVCRWIYPAIRSWCRASGRAVMLGPRLLPADPDPRPNGLSKWLDDRNRLRLCRSGSQRLWVTFFPCRLRRHSSRGQKSAPPPSSSCACGSHPSASTGSLEACSRGSPGHLQRHRGRDGHGARGSRLET